MSCKTEIYKIEDRIYGNTSEAIEFQVLLNDVGQDITDATITMDFRQGTEIGDIKKSITVGSGITITDAVNGKFEIDSFVCDLPIGKILTDVKIVYSDNTISNYQKLFFNVLRPITY